MSSVFEIPLLYKVISVEESLPPVDPFLVYSSSKNKQFTQDNTIFNYAFEEDRSGLAKMKRPMPISRESINTFRALAIEKHKLMNPIGADGSFPEKKIAPSEVAQSESRPSSVKIQSISRRSSIRKDATVGGGE